jgi:hypothetical protein
VGAIPAANLGDARDWRVKVVVFQSANPDFFIAHLADQHVCFPQRSSNWER